MKIVFITNMMNHHQKPVADFLYKRLGDDYHFVTTMPIPKKFLEVGYKNNDDCPYILPYYKKENKVLINRLVIEADAVIMGGTHEEELINLRVKTGKLFLFYSERWHKRRRSYLALPLRYLNGYVYHRFTRFNHLNTYMLCASSFVPNDCKWAFAFKNKTYKWGYFPPFKEISINEVMDKRQVKDCVDVLYVARSLKLKHPELAIKAIQNLYLQGYKVKLTMVGGVFDGDKNSKKVFEYCKNQEKLTPDCITVLGAVENSKVRDLMLNSDIFVFTSDRNEGWGASLNEAMSSGCACVVSNAIGSAHFLINNEVNGLLFKNKSSSSLQFQLKRLLDDNLLRKSISVNAYNTIQNEWRPEIAGQRLLGLIQNLMYGKDTDYQTGPCSKAKPVK